MVEPIDFRTGREVLSREFPYRGCPECCRPLDWQYSSHDLEAGVLGLGTPICSIHGKQRGWVVVEGGALQGDFLTGGFVAESKEWGEVA